MYPPMPNPPPLPVPRPIPGLRLPLGRRRLGPGATVSLVLHVGIIVLVVLHGRALLERAAGRGAPGGGTEGAGVNFFTLPSAAPAEIALPAAPRVTVSDFPALRQIRVDLPRVELPRETVPLTAVTGAGAGPGAAGGQGAGAGAGTGAGADVGPGTGGGGDYIIASPRTAILPPLAKVPGSVAGHTYHVRFWVSAEGRVTRVEVEPPITDAGYSREFQQRMLAYQFYPARTRDGRNVASVVTVPLRIGN